MISETERETLKKYADEEGGREATKLAILIHVIDELNLLIEKINKK